MPIPDQEARQWLREFETACRGRDFDTGRRMFAEDAVAFGTWATAVSGLADIEREQWRNVWPRIREFRFEARPVGHAMGEAAWVAAEWSSEATGPDGQALRRAGRATFVLARHGGGW